MFLVSVIYLKVGFGGRHLKIRDVCMDLEPCFKVHNLVVIKLKNTKLGYMTNFNMIFYMVMSIYELEQICNSPQSPAQPQSGQLTQGLLLLQSFTHVASSSHDVTPCYGNITNISVTSCRFSKRSC